MLAVRLQAWLAVFTACTICLCTYAYRFCEESQRQSVQSFSQTLSTRRIGIFCMSSFVSPQTSGSESLCVLHNTCVCRSASRSARTCTAQQNRRHCTICVARCPVVARLRLRCTSVLPPLRTGHLQQVCAQYLAIIWRTTDSSIRICKSHPTAKPKTLHNLHSPLPCGRPGTVAVCSCM